ncbi:Predicted arabinose efflux permease, MFS family [Pseudonocardia thermophila]|uniref:Predicted arabinose efflux permease, MFS family n=2 Tax=Pseudonocardia thermophila TaxID=1848 RepID=A0A1M6PGW4_PSETH|nr:Predicted arabinose efflux permease, MFS family [Pseudonocardia thermophila]
MPISPGFRLPGTSTGLRRLGAPTFCAALPAAGAGARLDGRSEMNKQELKVVGASAAGTAFEWYDFFLYGALVPVIGSKFFGGYGPAAQTVFALLTFAAGFLVRPLGAVIFARLTDLIGRKVVFLITLILMGASTVAVGLLPTSAEIGILAPILLVTCRILQGLAISGEYGAAITYVSEYAPRHQRAFFVGWLVGTTPLALSLSLAVQLVVQGVVGPEAYVEWGWRIPFIISVIPLAMSVWIRAKLNESPLFLKMKEEGTRAKAPLREAFGTRARLRMFGVVLVLAASLAFIGYLSTVYLLTTTQTHLKVDPFTVNCIFMVVMLVAFALCVFFCWLSDRVGRKPVMFTGIALSVLLIFPIANGLTTTANPQLARAQETVRVTLNADPAQCSFQFNPVSLGGTVSPCDQARNVLQANSVIFHRADATGPTTVVVNGTEVREGPNLADELTAALVDAGYPVKGSAETVRIDSLGDLLDSRVLLVALLVLALAALSQAVQGPAAATMAEVFPTRIRTTALSIPYQIGVAFFGGLLPATMVAIGAELGSFTAALWYPVIGMTIGLVILLFTLPETRDTDLSAVHIKGDVEDPEPAEEATAGDR